MQAATDLGFFMITDTGMSQAEVLSWICTDSTFALLALRMLPRLNCVQHGVYQVVLAILCNVCDASQIDSMFARGAQFFALDDEVKAGVPCDAATFVGWEKDAEVSPATGPQAAVSKLAVQCSAVFCTHTASQFISQNLFCMPKS